MLMREIKDIPNKYEGILHSWIERLNAVKMFFYRNLSIGAMKLLSESRHFFFTLRQTHSKIYMERYRAQNI